MAMGDKVSGLRKKPIRELTDGDKVRFIHDSPDILCSGTDELTPQEWRQIVLDDHGDETESLAEQVAEKTAAKLREHRTNNEQPEKLPVKKRDFSKYFDECDLTDAQREVISLKLEYGLSVNKISKRLGISRPAVDERLLRAQKKLSQSDSLRTYRKRSAARRNAGD
jgi:RNA polymerase sigma factor (sigma-70 family)